MQRLAKLRQTLTAKWWNVRAVSRRFMTAWRYAIGRTTITDAWNLYHHAEHITGFYCLEGLGEESLLQVAIERYGDRPELESIVAQACSRVADKWDSNGMIADTAEDWALDLIHDYAAARGIERIDEDEIEEADA